VPGHEHALWMRAVVRAIDAGATPPPVDAPVRDLEAAETQQVVLRAPDNARRARLFDVVEAARKAALR
jgi:hypothetical protein